ncbi:MAG: Crp/Fnr family transcriptional regulator [Methylococcaceae bacterium]|jgi:CRP-like cAMP-binding protein
MLLVEKFKPDTVIFKEGDVNKSMYIILDGTIQLYVTRNGKDVELAVIGTNDFFGEIEMYGQKARCMSAKSLTPARLVIIKNRMQLDQFIGQYPSFAGKVLRIMGERLALANALLQE